MLTITGTVKEVDLSSIVTQPTRQRMIFWGGLAAFNKGIGGGGYGPVVTIGGILSGIPVKTQRFHLFKTLQQPRIKAFNRLPFDLLGIHCGNDAPGKKPPGFQKRVVTVEQAFGNGADYIVIGRPIRDAADPRAAAVAVQRDIARVFDQ